MALFNPCESIDDEYKKIESKISEVRDTLLMKINNLEEELKFIYNEKHERIYHKKFEAPELVDIKIEQRGRVVVNNCIIHKKSDNIVCLEINLAHKYCSAGATYSSSNGKCGLFIEASNLSTGTKEDAKFVYTLITFPEYKWYKVYTTESEKSSIKVVLVK
mgnify:CR=1 FL=1